MKSVKLQRSSWVWWLKIDLWPQVGAAIKSMQTSKSEISAIWCLTLFSQVPVFLHSVPEASSTSQGLKGQRWLKTVSLISSGCYFCEGLSSYFMTHLYFEIPGPWHRSFFSRRFLKAVFTFIFSPFLCLMVGIIVSSCHHVNRSWTASSCRLLYISSRTDSLCHILPHRQKLMKQVLVIFRAI